MATTAKKREEEEEKPTSAKEEAPKAEPKKKAKKEKKEEDEDKVLPRGNPLRRMRGGVTAGIGGFLAFLLMAHHGQLRYAVPLGFLCVLVAAFGVMDVVGTFDDPGEVASSRTLRALASPVASVASAMILVSCALMGGQSGWGNQWAWGGAVFVTFILMIVAVFKLGVALGGWDESERPLYKRHGFWLLVLASALYLPALGLYSLWDPWETHYGEVAREMLARDDWVSLWWAQDGWFWSKPILNFWIQALAMSALGTHYKPDEMLIGAGGATAHPEWVVRFPNFLLTILAMYLLYKAVARVFGRRTGLIAGVVLATMPDWFFLAHQTMTDMPFVGPMTGTMSLVVLGMTKDPEEKCKLHELNASKRGIFGVGCVLLGVYLLGTAGAMYGRTAAIAVAIVTVCAVGLAARAKGEVSFRLSAWHLVFGAILVCAIPQILYLLSRNIELVLHGDGAHGFRAHWDEFRSGSGGGNCGLPGNEACNPTNPASIPRAAGAHPETIPLQLLRLFGGFEPFVQVLLWAGVLSGVLYLNWGERRVQRLYYLAAWFLAALATMGKGPVGFVLPIMCTFFFIATQRKWAEILRFEVVSGLLVIAGVAIPWYVAMYVRHGSPFTDRLIFHDMFNRAFHHVHDTNEGDDTSFRFYIWQLGYALFPWVGLAPLALLWWARARQNDLTARVSRREASVFFAMWFLTGFTLFTFMGTKFHHYIFPVVPAIAALIGIMLGDMIGEKPLASRTPLWSQLALYAGAATVAVVALCAGMHGSVTGLEAHWTKVDQWVLGVGFALMALPLLARLLNWKGAAEGEIPDEGESHEGLMFGAAAMAAAIVLGLLGRDLATKTGEGGDQPGAIRLLHLFTYNYRRPWPDYLDFHVVLSAFAIPAVIVAIALAVRAFRTQAVLAFGSFAVVWSVWALDVYMVETAQHWGQHEIIQAYYQKREGPQEPLIAYQMNWKGENFYTGNKIPAYVSSGANFTNWVRQQRDKGTKVMFFVTEHTRTGGLRSEVGAKNYTEVTDRRLCNKFVLVRAEL